MINLIKRLWTKKTQTQLNIEQLIKRVRANGVSVNSLAKNLQADELTLAVVLLNGKSLVDAAKIANVSEARAEKLVASMLKRV